MPSVTKTYGATNGQNNFYFGVTNGQNDFYFGVTN
jgi:hypothetical protein